MTRQRHSRKQPYQAVCPHCRQTVHVHDNHTYFAHGRLREVDQEPAWCPLSNQPVQPLLPDLDHLIGYKVYFQGTYLGVITRVRYGAVAWSTQDQWSLQLDNGHWLRDISQAEDWHIETEKKGETDALSMD